MSSLHLIGRAAVFHGCVFTFSGNFPDRTHKQLGYLVTEYGGSISTDASEETTHLVCTFANYHFPTKKVKMLKDIGSVRIVKCQFLDECIKAGERLNEEEYKFVDEFLSSDEDEGMALATRIASNAKALCNELPMPTKLELIKSIALTEAISELNINITFKNENPPIAGAPANLPDHARTFINDLRKIKDYEMADDILFFYQEQERGNINTEDWPPTSMAMIARAEDGERKAFGPFIDNDECRKFLKETVFKSKGWWTQWLINEDPEIFHLDHFEASRGPVPAQLQVSFRHVEDRSRISTIDVDTTHIWLTKADTGAEFTCLDSTVLSGVENLPNVNNILPKMIKKKRVRATGSAGPTLVNKLDGPWEVRVGFEEWVSVECLYTMDNLKRNLVGLDILDKYYYKGIPESPGVPARLIISSTEIN